MWYKKRINWFQAHSLLHSKWTSMEMWLLFYFYYKQPLCAWIYYLPPLFGAFVPYAHKLKLNGMRFSSPFVHLIFLLLCHKSIPLHQHRRKSADIFSDPRQWINCVAFRRYADFLRPTVEYRNDSRFRVLLLLAISENAPFATGIKGEPQFYIEGKTTFPHNFECFIRYTEFGMKIWSIDCFP